MKKLLLVLVVVIVSCKSETKENTSAKEEVAVIEAPAKELEIEMNFKTNKEDDFKLAVNNIIKDEFQKKSVVITEKVSPSSSMEKIIANFGENIVSNSIRFDLGNKELKEIEIQTILVSYGANSLSIPGSQLHKYFIINKFVAYDSISQKLTTQKVEGAHYPAIALNRKAIVSLTKE